MYPGSAVAEPALRTLIRRRAARDMMGDGSHEGAYPDLVIAQGRVNNNNYYVRLPALLLLWDHAAPGCAVRDDTVYSRARPRG